MRQLTTSRGLEDELLRSRDRGLGMKVSGFMALSRCQNLGAKTCGLRLRGVGLKSSRSQVSGFAFTLRVQVPNNHILS